MLRLALTRLELGSGKLSATEGSFSSGIIVSAAKAQKVLMALAMSLLLAMIYSALQNGAAVLPRIGNEPKILVGAFIRILTRLSCWYFLHHFVFATTR